MAIKHFTNINFKGSTNIDGLYFIESYRKEIVYDKPIYVGTSILDISKVCMLSFHYNVIHKNFAKYHLVYTDTDSLIYLIYDDDIYKWQLENKEHFDMSESLRDDMNDSTNKKVLGVYKCEAKSLVISEGVFLAPKSYDISIQTPEEFNRVQIMNKGGEHITLSLKQTKEYGNLKYIEKKAQKGISTVVVNNEISMNDFKNTLNKSEILTRNVRSIRSFNHQLFSYVQEKNALVPYYDKMVMNDEINCTPFGYKQ